MRKLLTILLLLGSIAASGQVVVTYADTSIADVTSNWQGVEPDNTVLTTLTVTRSRITAYNEDGYMLQAGTDLPTAYDGNFNGAVISGCYFDWKGAYASPNTHVFLGGYSYNQWIIHNFFNSGGLSDVFEGTGDTITDGGFCYNVVKKGYKNGISIAGITNFRLYNCTIVKGEFGKAFSAIRIQYHQQTTPDYSTHGTKVKNCLIVSTTDASNLVSIDSSGMVDAEFDYNCYWVEGTESHEPTFTRNDTYETYTWTQWRALGFDAHSVIADPKFIDTINYVPSEPLKYGTDLGEDYKYALAPGGGWVVGQYPDTVAQGVDWQVGAYVVQDDPGGDHYVSPGGDDGAAGTFAAPWATLEYGIDNIDDGDTLYVRGGYYPTTSTIDWYPETGAGNDGSEGNIISVFNFPGETPVFDFKDMHPTGDDLYNTAFFLIGVDYATIRGLEIKNVTQRPTPNGSGLYDLCYGVRSQYGNHLRFERMRVHDVAGNCMRNSLAHYVEVINCDSWNACDTLHATLPGNWGAGFAAGNTEFTDGYLYHYGCRAWECSDNAFVGSGNRSRVVWDHCWTFDNGYLEGEGIGWKLGYWTAEQLVDTLMTVKNCIAANCLYDGITGNEGTTAGSNGYVGYYHLYNNFVYNSGRNGIKFRNTAETDAEEQKRKDYNNLTYANEQDFDDYLGEHTGSNNSYDSEVTVTAADFISLDVTQLYGERQVDGSLPDITFGTLAGTSDLINAGTYVGIDTIGAGADIGWKEYGTPEGEEPPAGEAPNVIIFKPYPVVLRSATVSGNCNDDGGGTVSARGICWATTENPDLADNVITSGSGTGSFSVTITGLAPGTVYYARAYATNEVGTSYSSQYTFTTPEYQQISSSGVTIYSNDGKVIVVQ